MGRHPKTVPAPDGSNRRETGFYRTPAFLAAYVAKRLSDLAPDARSVFDPCIGDGAFVAPWLRGPMEVHGLDVRRFPLPDAVRFEQTDFLRLHAARRATGPGTLPHDAWVLNPPYNCHEVGYIRAHKANLKQRFPDVGVYNLYSLFLAAAVDLARPGAFLAALTLDSFLTARAHAPLRRRLLSTCRIHELVLCSTDLFRDQGADVRTCLLLLEKRGAPRAPDAPPADEPVRVLDRLPTREVFEAALDSNRLTDTTLPQLVLLGEPDRSELVVGLRPPLRALFSEPRLRDRFRCFTGISTGDDRKYLRTRPGPGHGVPFYKNPGRQRFYCPPDAYLPDTFDRIAERVPNFMVRNRRWLLEPGLVCSSMGVPFSACYRPADTTFGVNANVSAGADAWWMLAYLNSSLVTYLVRGVLARSNMVTAGYVGRIPVPALDATTRRRLSRLAREAWRRRVPPDRAGAVVRRIDAALEPALELPPDVQEHLRTFTGNLLALT